MSRATIADVAQELVAHERECVVYREEMNKKQDDCLHRIRRLELMVMSANAISLAVLGAVLAALL